MPPSLYRLLAKIMTAYIIDTRNNSAYRQFLNELMYALRGLSLDELVTIMKTASIAAGKQTLKQKAQAVKSIYKFTKGAAERYKKDGIIHSLQDDYQRAKAYSLTIPAKVRGVYDNFLKLPREQQIEQVAILLLTLSIFYLSSGGTDLEGGIPDTDIAIAGIGAHRNLFSHTILVGFGLEFAARTGIMIIEKMKDRLPEPHLPIWDKTYSFIDKSKELGIAAMWAGIGLHLLKDSGIITGGVKAYTGMPFSMPIEAHQGLFAANGLACEMFAVNK